MKRLLILLLIALAVLAVPVGTVAWRLREPFKAWTGTEQFVEIPAKAGSKVIGERLADAHIVTDPLTFRVALWLSGQGRRLKAGEYRFDRAMTPDEVIDKLARGDVYVVPITFREGLTVAEMAAVWEQRGFGPAAAFLEAAKDASLVHAIDAGATSLEGYLFPSTYQLSRHTTASQLVRLMVEQFQKAWTPELRQAAAARGLTAHQVVTFASVVEKETGRGDERPMVAAVYQNRYRIGMPLQCDPTVIYALTLAGKYNGNLHHDDLQFDSPYNTYRYPGLPPGPIASPGKASLEAVVAPADVPYLYFVSRNDGSHAFAQTLDEHNRNVQKFQVQYFRDKRRH